LYVPPQAKTGLEWATHPRSSVDVAGIELFCALSVEILLADGGRRRGPHPFRRFELFKIAVKPLRQFLGRLVVSRFLSPGVARGQQLARYIRHRFRNAQSE